MSSSTVGGTAVLAIGGIADLSTAPTLQDRLTRATVENTGGSLIVDLDGITLLDDVAIGLLLGASSRMRDSDGDLRVVCSAGRIRDRLSTTQFDKIVRVDDSIS